MAPAEVINMRMSHRMDKLEAELSDLRQKALAAIYGAIAGESDGIMAPEEIINMRLSHRLDRIEAELSDLRRKALAAIYGAIALACGLAVAVLGYMLFSGWASL